MAARTPDQAAIRLARAASSSRAKPVPPTGTTLDHVPALESPITPISVLSSWKRLSRVSELRLDDLPEAADPVECHGR